MIPPTLYNPEGTGEMWARFTHWDMIGVLIVFVFVVILFIKARDISSLAAMLLFVTVLAACFFSQCLEDHKNYQNALAERDVKIADLKNEHLELKQHFKVHGHWWKFWHREK